MPADVTEDIFVSKIVYNYSGVLPATASIKLKCWKKHMQARHFITASS